MFAKWALITPLLLVVGCGSIGPRSSEILGSDEAVISKDETEEKYAVVVLDTKNAGEASRLVKKRNASAFIKNNNQKPVIIGEGDLVQISILTTSDAGFIDLTQSTISPISATSLPAQNVGTDGMVSVPPIGRVKAAGSSVQQLERLLSRRLGEVLIEPAVIVRILERSSARVSVLGAVQNPGIYPIDQNNTHLVEMLATAGGPTQRSSDLELTLSRRGQVGKAGLDSIYENPRLNVHVENRDIISLDAFERRVTVLGANGSNSLLSFDRADTSLADALGQAGGLANRRADKKGIFVFRRMAAADVRGLGVDTSEFTTDPVPIIFNLDMTKPQSIFAAREFMMSDKDLIYISDSLNEELSAIFSVFTNFSPTPAEFVRDATISSN